MDVQNIWAHGLKVLDLRRGLPTGAMIAGPGHFGPASISNVTQDLRLLLTGDNSCGFDKDTCTIKDVANGAGSSSVQI